MKCIIDIDYGDFYKELFCKISKARKDWKCCECRCDIPKGEEHEVFVGSIYNETRIHRTCMICLSIREKFCCNWTFEGVYEDIFHAIDSEPELEDCILMECSLKQYDKMVRFVSFLDQDPYGEDGEDK